MLSPVLLIVTCGNISLKMSIACMASTLRSAAFVSLSKCLVIVLANACMLLERNAWNGLSDYSHVLSPIIESAEATSRGLSDTGVPDIAMNYGL